MSAALKALSDQAVNVALAIFLLAIWLGLGAYLDAQPSETDALQASADISNELAAEHAARKEQP